MSKDQSFELRDIPGVEGYKVTRDGHVWSKLTSIWLKSRVDHRVYVLVYCNQKGYRVHRLVALAYLDNPTQLPLVNHKDGDKKNNHASNLEWCDDRQNKLHAYANNLMRGRRGSNHHDSKLTEENVREIRRRLADGTGNNATLGHEFGVHSTTVSQIRNGRIWSWLV